MKKYVQLSFAFLLMLFFTHSASAVNSAVTSSKDNINVILNKLSSEQILDFRFKQIEKATGTKLSLKEKAGVALAKYKINRLKKKGYSNEEIDSMLSERDFSFSFIGFLLGFFLSLLGLLLAWIFFGTKGLKSAAFGVLFGIILVYFGFLRN